ncbi:ankyrin repeat domain-containing protein [Nisaea acidiphila]|uniref:Ankyrin repeat domain-containing protein n=1 Tax=Nisaea acidiphila TaxID=1862145 RepID=A0A9J7AWE5_9PROT|nr:ankyrin repeat domain-containing protein [Nisaea acidiphila]UUX51122.1 ankyrin repeat domain-containing protein [Nisaea acidiphila]
MANLPARPSLEHLKGQAKQLHKLVRIEDQSALGRVGPYFGNPAKITLQQAQLVIAREYDFSSWTRMKRHIDAGLGARETTEQRANRFLDLVCLHYGPDNTRGPAAFEMAAAILEAHPEIVAHSPHVAAAAGDEAALARWLARESFSVDEPGGPFQWTPLMYAAYARLPGASSYMTGVMLLGAGADPNAHYLWGGTYRFSVLTGIFGDGEGGKVRLPEHPEMAEFARAVLEAGANPNDSQGAYNRCFNPDNTHLELMLEFGLKDSDPSNWWPVEDGGLPAAHRTMHWNLIIALRWGFADRARLLIEHGVDIDTPDNNTYPTFTEGVTPYQSALMRGLPDIAEIIKARGGDAEPLTERQQFFAACMSGDLQTAEKLKPGHMGKDPDTEAEILREAAGNGNLAAVETMIALGFELSPVGTQTALHAAAWRGQVNTLKVLLAAGADAKLRDPEHLSPPLGHAFYSQKKEAIALLLQAPMDIFFAAAMGRTDQIDARLAEDPDWLDAPFSRVVPQSANSGDDHWAPPLWKAAVSGQIGSVEHLLEKGANPDICDPSGTSIAESAASAGHSDVAELLREYPR